MAFSLIDKTTNNNDLANYGATRVTTSLPFTGCSEAIKVVRASSQYLSAGGSSSLDITSVLTIESWVRLGAAPSVIQWVVGKDHDTGGRSFAFGLDNLGKIFVQIAGVNPSVSATTALTEGTWRHIAFTYEDSTDTLSYYLDGSPDGTATNTGVLAASTASLNIGRRSYTASELYFDGDIAEVRIWNTLRTPSEISSNYNISLLGNENGLVAYYPFSRSYNYKNNLRPRVFAPGYAR